ncbi:MAG: hypothetical protein HYX27_08255 [Acidobacteria bacterium]|nr:hypothetical protein [Acidobacteriota bacterium]
MKETLLRLLRVPPEPSPPDGSPESIRIFRAGRNYYRWRLLVTLRINWRTSVNIIWHV